MNGTQQTLPGSSSGSVIEIPPSPDVPPPSKARTRPLVIGLILAGLAGFGAILAFFPAKSSELLLSLAYGRGLADGTISLGSEPFSFLLGDTWANPHWLFDALAYRAYSLDNGQGFLLIALKALGISICAAFFFTSLTCGACWSAPVTALVIGLGLLAASPYFDANSHVVAFPFVLLLMGLLSCRAGSCSKNPWNFALVALMGFWANLDSSFTMGLALWLLVLVLPDASRSKRGDFLVWVSALAACLINPFPGRGFITIPDILAPVGEVAARMDPLIVDRLFESGFSPERLSNPNLGLNPAGLAFPVLGALGVASFFLDPKSLGTWRLPAFLLALGLATYRHKAIPVFCCVGTVVACLNFIQGLGAREKWKETASQGGVLAFLVLLVASLLALPGFLHATGTNPRFPGWGYAFRDSHKALAEHLAKEHSRAPGRTLIASLGYPDHAAYVAWFAPGVRTYVDPRLHRFAGKYGEFAAVVEALAKPDTTTAGQGGDWRELLAKAGAVNVAASMKSMEASKRVLPRFLRENDWHSPMVTGGWVVATLRTKAIPAEERATAGKRFVASLVDVDHGKNIPQMAPTRVNTYSAWEFWQPRNDPSGNTDNADLLLVLGEALNPLPKLGGSARAVAEARWGLHQVPDAPRAHDTLLRALLVYGDMAGISARATLLTDLQEIELATACRRIIALQPGGSESLQGHGILAEIANKRGFIDMEVVHRKEIARIAKQFISGIPDNGAGLENPGGATTRDAATKDLDKLSKQLDALQGVLAKRLEVYTNELTRVQKTSGKEPRVLEKAVMALRLGLALEASKELDSPATLGQAGQNDRDVSSLVLLKLQLSIQSGMLDDAGEALASDFVRKALGGGQQTLPHPALLLPEMLDARNIHPDKRLPALTWLEVQLAAGQGDYQKAARLLGTIALEQTDFFGPRLNRRRADQVGTTGWLSHLARDQRTMEAFANSGSLALKADGFHPLPWLIALADTLAMVRQEDSERIRVPAGLIAELRVAEGNYLYLSGRPAEAGKSFRLAFDLATNPGQIAAQAGRLPIPNFWGDFILQSAVADNAQRLSGPNTPAIETARRMILLLELIMDQ